MEVRSYSHKIHALFTVHSASSKFKKQGQKGDSKEHHKSIDVLRDFMNRNKSSDLIEYFAQIQIRLSVQKYVRIPTNTIHQKRNNNVREKKSLKIDALSREKDAQF